MPRAPRRAARRGFWAALGPGLITGASDDDPSGIATYSQAGAQFGTSMCRVMLFAFPLMAAIQEISARIGGVTGQGTAGNIRAHYPRPLLLAIVSLLPVANAINLGADLGAMGDGGRLSVAALGFVPPVWVGAAELTRAELMRYVAELPWAPDAILQNSRLYWRIEAPDRIAVSAAEEDVSAEVISGLDAEGRVASAFAPDRPCGVGARFVPTPRCGRFFDYRSHHGCLLPFRAEVGWLGGGRKIVCWKGEVTGWRRSGV